MPITFPINWRGQLIDKEGRATEYLQRVFDQLFATVGSVTDVKAAVLFPATPIIAQFSPDEVAEAALMASHLVPPEVKERCGLEQVTLVWRRSRQNCNVSISIRKAC